jgi:hypothetical protein
MKPRPPQSAETRARHRASLEATWADPAKRAKQGEVTRRQMDSRDVRERVSKRTRAAMADPTVKARQRSGLVAYWTPERRQQHAKLTAERMKAWREKRLADARKVLVQLPPAEREAALRRLGGGEAVS